jgi:hypothetical protein
MPIKSPQSPKRTTNARFPRGVSGNPAGRPVGSRNRSTIIEEQLLTHQEALIGKAIEMALKGDAVALRLCLERIYPAPRERRIDLALPEVRNAAEATAAISTILSGIGDGQITPGEGEILAAIVETKQAAGRSPGYGTIPQGTRATEPGTRRRTREQAARALRRRLRRAATRNAFTYGIGSPVTAVLDRASSAGAPSPVIGLLLTGIQPAAAGTRRKAERWKKGRGGETF